MLFADFPNSKFWFPEFVSSYAWHVTQGQGIVREFYVVSGKNESFLNCQGNVREFYNFQFVSNDEKQKMIRAVY